MTAIALLESMRERGVLLSAREDRLAYDAPTGIMSADLRTVLVAYKPELLAVLSGDWLAAAMALLARVGDEDRRADLRYRLDERAGIAEYDGNLSRATAERLAYLQIAVDGEAEKNIGGRGESTHTLRAA